MNPIATKGALGLAASTAVAGTVGMAVKFSGQEKPRSIKDLLWQHKPEKRLLFKRYLDKEDGSQPEWKEAWKKYRTNYKDSERDPLGLLTKPVDLNDANAPSNFMESCESLFKKEVHNIKSDRYQLADNYCTRLTSVADLVWESNRKVLAKGNDGNSSEWKGLWKKYIEANLGKDTGKDEWQVFEKKWESTSDQEAATDKFRSKCESESLVKTGSRSHASYQKVIDYCSVPR
ncbi:hypothetical protein HF1_03960 [Mycoplasma haemofelis str. Langford 1]|uniref:Uncharacterized protein n=1 Tax=Mycoplasma haemofelis (strain Langford 1) TaxID=941640 RepID=E8ZGY3_MYCHL|nr:hypothetical protein [Mycoplasma haemofelis]CBY92404.1 hypothetical protein HF1_03960 [Mycoplasma haemofelis str. Langford 1]